MSDSPDMFGQPIIKKMGGMLDSEIKLAINDSEANVRKEWQAATILLSNDLAKVMRKMEKLTGDGEQDEGSIQRNFDKLSKIVADGFLAQTKRMDSIEVSTTARLDQQNVAIDSLHDDTKECVERITKMEQYTNLTLQAAKVAAQSATIVADKKQDIASAHNLLAEAARLEDLANDPQVKTFFETVNKKVFSPFVTFLISDKVRTSLLLACLASVFKISGCQDWYNSHQKPTTEINLPVPAQPPPTDIQKVIIPEKKAAN